MKKIIFILCLLNFFIAKGADKIMYNISQKGLNIRQSPSDKAKVIGTIPYGAKLSQLGSKNVDPNMDTRIDINGLVCYWVKVKYQNIEGYVIDAYLLPWQAPKANTKTLEDYIIQISKPLGNPYIYKDNIKENGMPLYTIENKKQLYQNGWFISKSIGYEEGGSVYYIPSLSMNQVYCLVQLIEDFKYPFTTNTMLKLGTFNTATAQHDSIEWKTDAQIIDHFKYYNKIEINWAEGPYYSLQIIEVNDGVIVSFSSGV